VHPARAAARSTRSARRSVVAAKAASPAAGSVRMQQKVRYISPVKIISTSRGS